MSYCKLFSICFFIFTDKKKLNSCKYLVKLQCIYKYFAKKFNQEWAIGGYNLFR